MVSSQIFPFYFGLEEKFTLFSWYWEVFLHYYHRQLSLCIIIIIVSTLKEVSWKFCQQKSWSGFSADVFPSFVMKWDGVRRLVALVSEQMKVRAGGLCLLDGNKVVWAVFAKTGSFTGIKVGDGTLSLRSLSVSLFFYTNILSLSASLAFTHATHRVYLFQKAPPLVLSCNHQQNRNRQTANRRN